MSATEATEERRNAPWRNVLSMLAVGLLGGLVAVASLTLVPPKVEDIGPATVSARVSAGPGRTDLRIPPLGEVHANTHALPLSFHLALDQVDVQRLGDSLTDSGDEGFTATLETRLRDLAVQVALRAFLAAIVAGAIAAALLPQRRWTKVAAGATGGALAVGSLLGLTGATYSVEAFEQPRFTGALTRAPVVIEALNKNEISLSAVRSRFDTAATRLTDLLAVLAEPSVDPQDDSVALLHISDVHSNPIGLEITRQLAERFDVDAIVDTGDLTNFGVDLETEFARLVADMPVPYLYVSGNHDSVDVQATMEELDNVTVVHGRTTELEGVTLFGWPDPTYTNWNLLPPKEAAELRVEEGAVLAEEMDDVVADVLLVHDPRTAAEAFGRVPLILAGHMHRQIVEERDGTRMLAVGSTGAAGLQTFTTDADMDYEAEIVYLRDGVAVAFDYVTFSGLGGDFNIKRRKLEPLGEPVPPSPTPTGDLEDQ